MYKLFYFFIRVVKKSDENELLLISYALTFKLVVSMFPLIIFLMTLIGFFNIKVSPFIIELGNQLPVQIMEIINVFLDEVVYTRHLSLLSSSLIISIYSASTGFNTIIKGLNKVYDVNESRSFLKVRLISIILVFVFGGLVVSSLLIYIFSDMIKIFIPYFLDSIFINIFTAVILFIMVLLIYKISVCKKLSFREMYPGALFTILTWAIVSKLFNIYVNNFSRYSMVYGSIGSVFILLFWMNIISFLLLLGCQINAVITSFK